jgi:hypothetical protein
MGERAMTPAEKQRRYRERKFGNKPPVTKSSTSAASVAEIKQLKAEVARLKADLAEFGNKASVTKPDAELASLPKSSRARFEAMVRRQEREYEARVKHHAGLEARKLVDEVYLPNLRKRLEEVERQNKIIDRAFDARYGRDPLISRAMFRKALACLHPDGRATVSEKMLSEVFAVFSQKTGGDVRTGRQGVNRIEIALCGKEADRPKAGPPLPTWEELQANRAAYDAKNRERAKRAAATRAERKAAASKPV